MPSSILALAKITAKGQTAIPQSVRVTLHMAAGDPITREVIEGGATHGRRARALDLEYLRAVEGTLDEWSGPADEAAYRDL